MALPYNKKNAFQYIKLYSMCKSVVGYNNSRFKPIASKAYVWSNNIYNILCWIKQNTSGLIALVISASAWHKGIGQSLNCTSSAFYSVVSFSYGNKLINRAGANRGYDHKLIVRKSLCELETCSNLSSMWLCLVYNRVFKLCCHSLTSRCEFDFIELNKLTAFRQLKRHSPRFVLRCTSNHTKRVVRSVISSALIGGEHLWDLGSGSGGLGLCWCSRGGVHLSCFEKSTLSLKLSVYNVNLVLQSFERVSFFQCDYKNGLFGISLPDRVFFGCGLKCIRDWRLAYVRLKFGGCAVVVSVSNLGRLCIGLLNIGYSCNSYSLVVHKIKLKLNAKLYTLCASLGVCIVRKVGSNVR
ncbi:MAG: hypothetical protein AAI978_00350 [Candidatus Hodgkinia cicadicola]